MQKLHVQLAGRDGVSAAADAVGEPCESTSSHHQHAEQQRTRTYKKSFFRCTAPLHIRISFCLFSEIKRHTILFSVPFDFRPPKGGWKHEKLKFYIAVDFIFLQLCTKCQIRELRKLPCNRLLHSSSHHFPGSAMGQSLQTCHP